MSKHEARTSLLGGNSLESRSYTAYEGGYHHREGFLPPNSPRESRSRSWLYIPNSKWTWSFFAIVFLQAIIALALEGYVFQRFESSLHLAGSSQPVAKVVPTYLSLFIFGFLYQLWLVYDALRLKNTIQIIGLCIYNIGLLIEAAVQSDQIRDALNEPVQGGPPNQNGENVDSDFLPSIHPFVIAVPCLMALGTILMSLVAWKLYDEFAWSIYKNISADLRLKRRFLSYQIYIALLKFDFFFFLAFTVQFIVVVRNTPNVEFGLTIAAIPFTILILFLAAYWTRKENVFGMIIVIVIYLGGLAYFFFKLFRMYFDANGRGKDYYSARHSLTTFAILTIVCVFVTIIYAIICTANFNKGLKPHIQSDRQRRRNRGGTNDTDKMYGGSGGEMPLGGHHGGMGGNRMTID